MENRHLSPSKRLRHPGTEDGRLGRLVSHAQVQALGSDHSIRMLVEAQEEEAAV